jgi:cell division protein FtsW
VGITFQPSDFLKVTTVVMLALQLARRQKVIEKISLLPTFHQIKYDPLKAREILRSHTLPVFGIILLSCSFIVPENMSTALLMGATCVIMLIIGRVKWADIGRFMIIAAVVGSILIGGMMIMKSFTGGENRTGTWGKRITAFISPESVDEHYLYQPRQAKIAIAMGKFWGRGVGNSAQQHMLPKAESDYAFAFLVEEWGFVGAIFAVALYLWIFYRAIVIFNSCGTAFPCLLVLGLAFLVSFQGLLHMMVSTGLMFQTGLVLPLISQGGSAELFTSMAIGMILGVSRQVEEKTLSTPKSESMLEVNRKK